MYTAIYLLCYNNMCVYEERRGRHATNADTPNTEHGIVSLQTERQSGGSGVDTSARDGVTTGGDKRD